VRRVLLVGLLVALASCHSREVSSRAEVHPQREQVRSFERPGILAAARRTETPMPVIILIERNPWLAVVGADSPSFALYEDGALIRRIGEDFVFTQLTPAEQTGFLNSVSADDLRPFYGHYQAHDMTDQTTEQLLLYGATDPVFISVYGASDDPSVRARVPGAVVRAFDAIKSFRSRAEHPWRPEKIEVMVWPYEYAPDASTEWPRDLPDLNDASTVRRGDESFSIFVPASRLHEVQTVLSSRNEKGAVEINGRKWAVSIRLPFPHEQLWIGSSQD
jgi:hypothetical protein